MSNDLVTITRATVKRGWTEFEPKVITGLLTGATGAAVVAVLKSMGFDIDATIQQFITVGCYFLGSYLTPSSGMVVTTNNANGDVVTQTTGHTVTTATAGIPIQAPAATLADMVKTVTANNPDLAATQVLGNNVVD